jgi:hypothetical protein
MTWQRTLATLLCIQTLASFVSGCGDDDGNDNMTSPVGGDDAGGDAGRDAGATFGDAGAGNRSDAAVSLDGGGTLLDAALRPDATATAPDGGVILPAADYTKKENWLCRPDNNAACDIDLDTTIVKADGTLEVEDFTPATNPEIDCFYVYPTVSLDTTPNSDLIPGDEERNVVRAQFARFAKQCRLFAPMYRQVTLTALRAGIANMPLMTDSALGYRDVQAAWRHYLANDNKGRGVILVSHSQGSSVLTRLIRDEIDPDPSKTPFIGGFLIGTNITTAMGQTTGGSFSKVPVCKTPAELGCVIGYVSFRTSAPPPSNTRFGRTTMPGQTVACANPAALGGGPAELNAYLSRDGAGASGLLMGPWVNGNDPAKMVKTPFVRVPGLLTGECKVDAQGSSYLAVTVNGNPADPRVDEIVGDVVTNGQVQADWGLHLIDVHVGMGNLLDIAKAKADAYKAKTSP